MQRLIKSKQGMALVLVVLVLSSMLLLGTAFMSNIRLDLKAASNYSREGQTEIFALEGLHRAMGELMYDVWGVNEDTAFVCAPEWGQMTKGLSVEGTNIISAYAYDGKEQIISPRSLWRRTKTPVIGSGGPVQTDYRWIDRESLAYEYPTQSGGYYWDEFLPEQTDNYDAFEAGLMLNHGTFTDRDYCNDGKGGGGLWSSGWIYGNWYFPAVGGGDKPPWDYVDTRIVPDAFYHIFRFDLIAPDDNKVHCTGVRNQDPKQVIDRYRQDKDFRATHLGVVTAWNDSWGGALNINQVNNNYNWEVLTNYKAAQDVPEQSRFHFKDAKWINVYSVDGERVIGRYAVTVWPDCGTPNPNYMYDGRGQVFMYNEFHVLMADMGAYFATLDSGWSPHGYSQWVYPNWILKADRVKSTKVVDNPAGSNWTTQIQTRFAEHNGKAGLITGRSELNMLMRKWGFDPDEVSKEDLESESTLLSAMTAPSAYEYLLGPHWDKDRLVIDIHKNGVFDTLNKDARKAFASYLQDLTYYWGPDERTGEGDEFSTNRYKDRDKLHVRMTPYHDFHPNYPAPVDEWDARARNSKAKVIAFASKGGGGNTRYYVNADSLDAGANLTLQQLNTGAWMSPTTALMYKGETANTLVNEVGVTQPSHPAGQFDGGNYYFVELVIGWGDAHYEYDYSLNGAGIQVGSPSGGYVDVFADPKTLVVGRGKGFNNIKVVPPGDVWKIVLHTWGYSAESAAHRMPDNYAVVYFPKDVKYDSATEVVVTYLGKLHQRVKLPDALGKLGQNESYSAFDAYNTEDPTCFQKTEATPSWRLGPCGKQWHGTNQNWYPRFFPGNRVDINNMAKLGDMSTPDGWVPRVAAGRACQYHDSCMHPYEGTPFIYGVTQGTFIAPEMSFETMAGKFPQALDNDGYYDPYNSGLDACKRTYLLQHYYDADLVNWRDLSEVAPIERLFAWGMQNNDYKGPIPVNPKNLDRQFSPFDGWDNNMDGMIDGLTSEPMNAAGVRGYYQSDRKTFGRYNINEMPHPAATAVSNVYGGTCPTLYIGRKPLKGYTSFWQISSRSQYCRSESDTPYDKRIWYDNLFADCGSDHMHSNGHIQYQLDEIANTSRAAHTGNSPVHTVYITAQVVAQDQANPLVLVPTSEVKVRATVERTWDGKMNVLEFNWIPQDGTY
jgi:hypothetical protein